MLLILIMLFVPLIIGMGLCLKVFLDCVAPADPGSSFDDAGSAW
jgi:hypothetical protein